MSSAISVRCLTKDFRIGIRGLKLRAVDDLSLEIHISKIETTPGQITIFGEASLWKENLRIYEVKPLALMVVDAD